MSLRVESWFGPEDKGARAVVDVLIVCNLVRIQDFMDEAVGGGPSPRDKLLMVSDLRWMLSMSACLSVGRRPHITHVDMLSTLLLACGFAPLSEHKNEGNFLRCANSASRRALFSCVLMLRRVEGLHWKLRHVVLLSAHGDDLAVC